MIRRKISIMIAAACVAAIGITGCSQQKNNTETVEQSKTESMTKEEKDIVLKVKGIKNYTVSASSIKDKDTDTARKDIQRMVMDNVSSDDLSITDLSLDVSQVDPAVCDNYKMYFNVSYVDDQEHSQKMSIERNLLLADQTVADTMVSNGSVVLGYEKQVVKETEEQTEKQTEKQTESETKQKETEKRETVAAEIRETKETEKQTESTKAAETQKPAKSQEGNSAVSVIEKETETAVKHEHRYTSKVTTRPTCTEEGVRTYTCVCGYSYTESIPATGHAYDGGVITTEPTCTSEGVKTFTCANCGKAYTEPVAKSAHNWITKTEKVMNGDGSYDIVSRSVCSACGEEK